MEIGWSDEIASAVASAGSLPARVRIPELKGVQVLLPLADYQWIRETVQGIADAPLILDPSQQSYAVLPLNEYERVKAFFEEDPVTREEQLQALRAAGLRAGWNDPEWNEEDGHPS
jgi:hypothetical protein